MMDAIKTALILTSISMLIVVLVILAPGPAQSAERRCGVASFYGVESGDRTATGERFTGAGMTAAMPSRAMLGRRVRVTDMASGRSIVIRVNDLGPCGRLHRIIDLSRHAAEVLGIVRRGTAQVCIQ